MNIDTTTLIIGAIAVGGFLYYRNLKKKQALAQSQGDNGDDSLGGGGGGGFGSGGGSTTADIVPAPSLAVVQYDATKRPIFEKDPIREAIADGSLTLTPTTSTTPISSTKPVQELEATKQITSKFLTFDGEYFTDNNVVLDFEGNID